MNEKIDPITDVLISVERPFTETSIEIQHQINDDVVRTIAMGPSEVLDRDLGVENIGSSNCSTPDGKETLERIMTVLGNTIDNKKTIHEEGRMFHREAPLFDEQIGTKELLETGIQATNSIYPFSKVGKTNLFGGTGIGKTVNTECDQVLEFHFSNTRKKVQSLNNLIEKLSNINITNEIGCEPFKFKWIYDKF